MRVRAQPGTRRRAPGRGERAERLYYEVQMLHELLPAGQWVQIAAVLVVFGLLFRHVDHKALLDWLGFVLLIIATREVISVRYRRSHKSPERAQFWFNAFLAGTVLYGVLWSGTAIILVPVESPTMAGLTALILCGLGAGAVAVSSVNLEVFLAYAASSMLPYAALLITTRLDPQSTIGWLIIVFFALISIVAARVHLFFARLVDLQLKTRFLEGEVRHESDKRRLAEKALLDNTLEEELAELIRRRAGSLEQELRDADAGAGPAQATVTHTDFRRYLHKLEELVINQLRSAEEFVVLLRRTHLTSEQGRYLSIVEKIVHDAGHAIAGLNAPPPDTSAVHTDDPVNVRRLLIYMSHELPLAHKAKYTTLRRQVERDVPRVVYGDETALREILHELVKNSFQYSDGGVVLVSVKTVEEERNSVTLEFRIEDAGVGIPDSAVRFLSGKDNTEPAGSGLALVRDLVEQRGGDLFANSVAGVGSTVGFRIPFRREATETVHT